MKEKTADIDILEDLLSTQKQYIEDKDYQKEHNIKEQAIDYAKMWTKATENLIVENKELKEKIENIQENFLKYNWKEATKEQIYNQVKSLYDSVF